jgi:hypothetical protein
MAVSKEWKSAYDRQRYLKNRADPEWVARNKERLANLSEDTKERRRAWERAYRAAHREDTRAYMKARRAAGYFREHRLALKARDPERLRRQEHAHRIARVYGIPYSRYEAMHEAQGGVCAICKRPETSVHRGTVAMLAVDHDRAHCPTRKSCGQCVRGLLCARCNAALGQVGDSPDVLRAMIAYLG